MPSLACSFLKLHSSLKAELIIFSSVFHSTLYKYQLFHLEHYVVLIYIFVPTIGLEVFENKNWVIKFLIPQCLTHKMYTISFC